VGFVIGVIIYLFINTLGTGTSAMMYIKGSEIELSSIKSEIQSVREAYYTEGLNLNNNTMISGSIDNMGQSKALSEYISMYAIKKSEHNKLLVMIQTRKKMGGIYYWFGDSAFIHRDVLNIAPVQ